MKKQAVAFKKYWYLINVTNNDRPNIYETILDEDIAGISAEIREAGVKEFTISSGQTDLIETLDTFKNYGIVIHGLVKVASNFRDFQTGEFQMKPALLMKVI